MAVGSGTYAYVVYACNVAGCSAASNQVTVTVHRIPDPPATLTVPGVTYSRQPFNVTWSASSEATSYTLTDQDVDAGGPTNTLYTGPNTGYTATLSSGIGDEYKFSVKACNANGCSGWKTATTLLENAGGNLAPASGSSAQ